MGLMSSGIIMGLRCPHSDKESSYISHILRKNSNEWNNMNKTVDSLNSDDQAFPTKKLIKHGS